MSIAALNQTYDEVRRLSIAGSDLARGDFRLKKLVDPLRKSAAKAPVFGKVADAIDRLLESDTKTSATALLELSSLIGAILYTQGETGAKGNLEPLPSQNLELVVSDTSARVLKPLIEALSTTGGGRLETIQNAHQRGAFKDLRLVKHALGAIDDPYSEIADFVSRQVLPIYGKAIYPELRAQFDPRGRGGHARRLHLMHQLDPERTRDIVDQALEEGSKEVKLEAIACLKGREDAVDFLLEQASSRTKDIRAKALEALASIDQPPVIEKLKRTIDGKDAELIVDNLASNPNPELQSFVLERLNETLGAILNPEKTPAPAKGGKKGSRKTKSATDEKWERYERAALLLRAVHGRRDGAAVSALLEWISQQDKLAALDDGYGEDLVDEIASALLASGDTGALETLADRGAEAPLSLLRYTVMASAKLRSPSEVYDFFSGVYLASPRGRSKAAELTREKSEVIGDFLRELTVRHRGDLAWHVDDDPFYDQLAAHKLDPRWLDAVVERKDLVLAIHLERPKHAGLEAFLEAEVQAELAKKVWNPSYQLDDILLSMARIEHPQVVPLAVRVIERTLGQKSTYYWGQYYLLRVIPTLPIEAVSPLEALISGAKAPEGMVEVFVSCLDELKQKART